MRLFHLPLLAALAGCATLSPLPWPRDAEVRLIVRQTEGELRGLLQDLADPVAVPAYARASGVLDAARVAVATDAALAGADFGLAAQAERAALGVTLTVCAQGVAKLAGSPRDEAERYARGVFSLTCVVPLGVFAVR